MKWLITGGAGFIGTNAAIRLLEAGHTCVLADNFHRPGSEQNRRMLAERYGLRVQGVDVRHGEEVDAFIAQHSNADVVLHLAGQVSFAASLRDPRYDFDTNARGTFNVLEAVRQFAPGARVIYSSSNKVYGDLEKMGSVEDLTRYRIPAFPYGLPEWLPLDLHGGYSCSKGTADFCVRDYAVTYGLKTVSLRQSSIYGGHQHATEDQGWAAWFVREGLRREPFRICGTGKQVRDLLHVSDLCDLFLKIAALPEHSEAWGKAFNIGGGPSSSLSLLELFGVLESEFGLPMQWTSGPPRPADQKVFIADTTLARCTFDWEPATDLRTGLEELVTWSRTQ